MWCGLYHCGEDPTHEISQTHNNSRNHLILEIIESINANLLPFSDFADTNESVLLLRSSGTLLNLHEIYAHGGCHGNERYDTYTHTHIRNTNIYYTSKLKYAYMIVFECFSSYSIKGRMLHIKID